jgi:hypothetical protein
MITPEERAKFLELIAQGETTKDAAREAGEDLTGTKFRALTKEHAVNYDPEFAQQFKEAQEEGRNNYKDKLRKEARDRVFDRQDPASAKLLPMEMEAHLEEYDHKRIRHSKIGQDAPFQIQAVLPTVSQEVLDAMPVEELEELVGKLRALQQASEPKLRAIEGGNAQA